MKELRMIALLRQVANPGDSDGARWAGMRIHRIASAMMTELGYSSKLNAEWEFLCMLRDECRRCAEAFLKDHMDDLGPPLELRSRIALAIRLNPGPPRDIARLRGSCVMAALREKCWE
jgi:NTE family protein